MFRNLAIAAAVAAIGATPAALAHAAPLATDTESESVSLAGLDLTTAAGAGEALARIRYSAAWLCGAKWAWSEIGAGAGWDACFNRAVDTAVAEVNHPALTALRNSERR